MASVLYTEHNLKLQAQGGKGGGGGRGEDFRMKGRGCSSSCLGVRVNYRFWSRLGCSGQNTIIFSRKGLF